MRILLAGASGLIGSEVALRATGHETRTLVRRAPRDEREYAWEPDAGILTAAAVEWADVVISLSGASLARLPWTARYREEILRSRIETTSTIAKAIASADAPPSAWISASAVGYYGDRPGDVLTEAAARGEGYLADVVTAWEQATAVAADRTRVVHARTGLVLARGGALRPLILTTRLGLGASVGNGRQHWPWIGLGDEARALLHLATASELAGPVNLVGPTPATATDITRAIARALHRPHLLRLPRFALTAAMGLAAHELLLSDQRVVPQALQEDGFAFSTPTVDQAVAAVLTS